MNENIRTEEENRKIGWYFVIFSGKERPAYFDGKNWIVWGNMGFWNDSDLSKISDRLIPYFHAQQLEKDNSDKFIISFADWLVYEVPCSSATKGKPISELLEIYRTTQTL